MRRRAVPDPAGGAAAGAPGDRTLHLGCHPHLPAGAVGHDPDERGAVDGRRRASPTDDVATPYGDIGKWMLEPNGQIADYGGLPYGGKTVIEPVNVIIVDPTSSSAAESAAKLNWAMFWSGFPGQPFHSTGFRGTIDDILYGQQPTGPLLGFSDNFFLFPNNHGRIFGPDPVETAEGYVWSGAFSTEEFVIYEFLPGTPTSRPTWPAMRWPSGSSPAGRPPTAAWSR